MTGIDASSVVTDVMTSCNCLCNRLRTEALHVIGALIASFEMAVQIDCDVLSCSGIIAVASHHSSASYCKHCCSLLNAVQAWVNAYFLWTECYCWPADAPFSDGSAGKAPFS